jgi:hypothetical protein
MEGQLSDYRNIHKLKYMEIERKRLDDEQLCLEEAKRKDELIKKALDTIDSYCILLKEANNLNEMIKILEKIQGIIDDTNNVPVEKLNGKGYDILETVNGNLNISINICNDHERVDSDRIKEVIIYILCKCGIEADDMDLEFNMDCSRDEEIARQLAQSFITPPLHTPIPRVLNTAPKKKRGRPPKVIPPVTTPL